MKRNIVFLLLFSSLFIFITACSSSESDKADRDGASTHSTESSNDMVTYSGSESFAENEMANIAEDQEDASPEKFKDIAVESDKMSTDQMIIHNAQLEIKVKDFEMAQVNIEKKVNEYGGYVVESNVYRNDDEHMSGHMSVRIPEEHFRNFLTDTKEEATNVLESNVTGQDVTEQYVDLQSRLKSKRVVEERLLAFLKDAEKTEDLLKISTDLAGVQEDIEVVVGKIKYLENQSSYSTVDIAMIENRIIVPELENKNLDTWENTKKQLATSLNFIFAAGSGLIVLFIGNLPIIIILLLIGSVIYFFVKRKIGKS